MAVSLGFELGLTDASKMEGVAKPRIVNKTHVDQLPNCFGRCLKGRVCNIGVNTNLHNLEAG